MTTNPSPTTQHFAAGPHQDWPRLPEGAERYLDSPTAGTLPADIPGGRHPILDALELHPVNGTRATDPVPTGFEVLYLAAGWICASCSGVGIGDKQDLRKGCDVWSIVPLVSTGVPIPRR